MAWSHGRHTQVSLGGNDLSGYIKNSEYNRSTDVHDVTHYGNESKQKDGGLKDGTFSMDGTYDNSSTGPAAVIESLLGTTQTLVRKPEGSGTAKPQQTVTVLVTSYVETNPHDNMVSWSCNLSFSGDVAVTDQA